MAAIYDITDGSSITEGLQGCNTCDEAIQIAQNEADRRGQDVHLVDDDGEWLVHPAREDGTREAADPIATDDE